MALTLPLSILTGLRTLHFPSGNLWNELQGALPAWAKAGNDAKIEDTKTVTIDSCLIMSFSLALMLRCAR